MAQDRDQRLLPSQLVGDPAHEGPAGPIDQRDDDCRDDGHIEAEVAGLGELHFVVDPEEGHARSGDQGEPHDPQLRCTGRLGWGVLMLRGRVLGQVLLGLLVLDPVDRVDRGRPPVARRIGEEPARPGHQHEHVHADEFQDHAVVGRREPVVEDDDERYRAVGEPTVDETGQPTLPFRVPLGHDVDATRVHQAGSDAAEHRVAGHDSHHVPGVADRHERDQAEHSAGEHGGAGREDIAFPQPSGR